MRKNEKKHIFYYFLLDYWIIIDYYITIKCPMMGV